MLFGGWMLIFSVVDSQNRDVGRIKYPQWQDWPAFLRSLQGMETNVSSPLPRWPLTYIYLLQMGRMGTP